MGNMRVMFSRELILFVEYGIVFLTDGPQIGFTESFAEKAFHLKESVPDNRQVRGG